MTKIALCSTEFRSGYVIEGSTVEVRDSYKDTVIGGQAQQEFNMSGVREAYRTERPQPCHHYDAH